MWPNVMQNQTVMPTQNYNYNMQMPVQQYSAPNYNISNIYNNMFMQQQPQYTMPTMNISNIYNNYYGGMQMPMMQPQMPMFQGQMFGGMPMMQPQMQMPMMQPQMQMPMMQPQMQMPMMQPQMFGGMPQMSMMPQTSMFNGQMLGGFGGSPLFQGQMFGGGLQNQFGYNPINNLMNYIMSLVDQLSGTGAGTPGAPFEEEIIIEDDLKGAWGDPHFNFKDKTGENVVIDHKSTKDGKNLYGETYNILNADGLDIDAEYKKHTDEAPQVMGAVRINAGNQELLMHEGKTTLDGKALKVGETKLADGRTVKVEENGNVSIKTKDGKGTFNIEKHTSDTSGSYYNIDPSGAVGINTKKDNGGILGFLNVEGKTQTKDEILKQYDTNKNGMLDSEDNGLEKMFRANKDIGLYATHQ